MYTNHRLFWTFLETLLAYCLVGAPVTAFAGAKKVTTVAGGYLGNGKPATSASLAKPVSVALGKAISISVMKTIAGFAKSTPRV